MAEQGGGLGGRHCLEWLQTAGTLCWECSRGLLKGAMTELGDRAQARMLMVLECTVLAPGPCNLRNSPGAALHPLPRTGGLARLKPSPCEPSGSCVEREIPPSPPPSSIKDSKAPKSCWSLSAAPLLVDVPQAHRHCCSVSCHQSSSLNTLAN